MRVRNRIRIRRATDQDIPVLIHQRRQMFISMGEGDAQELDAADRIYGRWVRSRIRHGTVCAFLATIHEATGPVVAGGGIVWMQERQPRPGFSGGPLPYLMSMYTEHGYRGRGVASAIVQEAIRWCAAEGHPSLSLHASPAGVRVYQRLGFTPTPEYRLLIPGRSNRRRR